jgi:hypothetical protein
VSNVPKVPKVPKSGFLPKWSKGGGWDFWGFGHFPKIRPESNTGNLDSCVPPTKPDFRGILDPSGIYIVYTIGHRRFCPPHYFRPLWYIYSIHYRS